MSRLFRTLVSANFHTWEIAELYSNADRKAPPGHLLAGRALTATRAGGVARSYVFPNDLPSPNTANRYVLIATQGYVDAAATYAEFRSAMPDYVMPNQFLPTDGGTINYAGDDSFSSARIRSSARASRA